MLNPALAHRDETLQVTFCQLSHCTVTTSEQCPTHIPCGTQSFTLLGTQEFLHVLLNILLSQLSESFLLITQSHAEPQVWA